MTRRLAVLVTGFALLMAAAPLCAQSGQNPFVSADTALDAAHATQSNAFLPLRDSIATISSAGARLMSDMTSNSSLAWMRSRARAVVESCARSVGPLAEARTATAGGHWPSERQQTTKANLLKAMTTFDGELRACQQKWKTLAADTSQTSLRERAPYQMKQLQDQVDTFQRTVGAYLRSIGLRLPPVSPPPA